MLIERAESLTLDWPRLGPAVPAYRGGTGDLVVLGSAAQLAGGTVQPGEGGDDEWLPADLRQLAGPLPVERAASGRPPDTGCCLPTPAPRPTAAAATPRLPWASSVRLRAVRAGPPTSTRREHRRGQ